MLTTAKTSVHTLRKHPSFSAEDRKDRWQQVDVLDKSSFERRGECKEEADALNSIGVKWQRGGRYDVKDLNARGWSCANTRYTHLSLQVCYYRKSLTAIWPKKRISQQNLSSGHCVANEKQDTPKTTAPLLIRRNATQNTFQLLEM